MTQPRYREPDELPAPATNPDADLIRRWLGLGLGDERSVNNAYRLLWRRRQRQILDVRRALKKTRSEYFLDLDWRRMAGIPQAEWLADDGAANAEFLRRCRLSTSKAAKWARDSRLLAQFRVDRRGSSRRANLSRRLIRLAMIRNKIWQQTELSPGETALVKQTLAELDALDALRRRQPGEHLTFPLWAAYRSRLCRSPKRLRPSLYNEIRRVGLWF